MPSTATDRIDGLTTSVAVKAPVVAATTGNITLSGTQTIDGVAVVANDRVLVKDQTTESENGIYEVSTTTWVRTRDFNGARDAVTGTLVWDTNGGVFYTVSTAGSFTIGTSNITFSRANSLNLAGVSEAANIAAMTSLLKSSLADNQQIDVAGYTSAGDGGGGKFYWVSSSSATEDLGTIFESDEGGATGRWLRIYSGDVNVRWFGSTGDGTTDDATADQLAFDAATSSGVAGKGWTIYFPTGTYMHSIPVTCPNATTIRGDGRWQSIIKAAAGFTGIILADKGVASKIIIQDIQVNANDEAGVTSLVDLGNGATKAWGTEGGMWRCFLRGGTSVFNPGTTGLSFISNVSFISDVTIWYCDNGFVEGANSVVSRYTNCVVLGADTRAFDVNTAAELDGCHIEAPTTNCVGLYVLRSANISSLVYALAASTVNAHAIEIDSGGVDFNLDGLEVLNASGGTLTDIIKDNRASTPPNWGDDAARPTTRTVAKDKMFLSGYLDIEGQDFRLLGNKMQNFRIRITNTAGTLQHRMTAVGGTSTASSFVDKITAAATSLTNTPTGADASTAFAAGGKISSANTNNFIFDVAAQTIARINGIASIVFNESTTDLTVGVTSTSRDVNGTTRTRFELFFTDTATGAVFALTAANIAAGKSIDVDVLAFIG